MEENSVIGSNSNLLKSSNNPFVVLSTLIKPSFKSIYKVAAAPLEVNVSSQESPKAAAAASSIDEGVNVIDKVVIQLSHFLSRVGSAPPMINKTISTFRIEKVMPVNTNIMGLKRIVQEHFGYSVDLNEISFHHEMLGNAEIPDSMKIIDLPVCKEMVEAGATSHDSLAQSSPSPKKKINVQMVETDRFVLPLEYRISASKNYGRLEPLVTLSSTPRPKLTSLNGRSTLQPPGSGNKKTPLPFNPDEHFPDFLGGEMQSKRMEMPRVEGAKPLEIYLSEPKSNLKEEIVYYDKNGGKSDEIKHGSQNSSHFLSFFDNSYGSNLKHNFLYSRTVQDIRSGSVAIDHGPSSSAYKWNKYVAPAFMDHVESKNSNLDSQSGKEVKDASNADTASRSQESTHNSVKSHSGVKGAVAGSSLKGYPFASILTSAEEEAEYYGDDRRDYDDMQMRFLLNSSVNKMIRRHEGFGGFHWGLNSFNDIGQKEIDNFREKELKKFVTPETKL